MLPTLARTYMLISLEGTPEVLTGFLATLTEDDPRWDFRPDPDRFTLREMVAHLATVEPNWRERALRLRDEDQPFFPTASLQNEKLIRTNPMTNLRMMQESRLKFTHILKHLEDSQWERSGQTEFMGPITLENQAVFVLAHDGYHIRQTLEWLTRAREMQVG